MKKIQFVFVFCLCLIGNISLCQTATTILTPKGNPVSDTYLVPEFTPSGIAARNAYVAAAYPNAIRLANASATYNCHAYAWHTVEGGNNVWLGYYTSTAEDVYWNDGSYIEESSSTYPGKVSYASDNHSAVTTAQANIFISKWGEFPLMQHEETDVPYNSSSLKFYKKAPFISGPDQFCTQRNYFVSNLPSGSTVSWVANPSSSVSIDNPNSASIYISRISDANVVLTADIITPSGNVTLTKNIYVGNPSITSSMRIEGPQQVSFYGGPYSYSVPDFPDAISYDWYVEVAGWGNYPRTANINPYATYADITFNSPGTHYITVKATTPCGEVWYDYESFEVFVSENNYMMSFNYYPNPTDNQLTVERSIDEKKSQDQTKKEYKEFEVSLLDNKGKKLRSIKSAIEQTQVVVNTTDIPDGVYFLHIKEGEKIEKKQVIIKH
ncbi:MAG: T9SS type A sorting domain-containing protein [Pyrinomonadaceae bacterium]|nr:T9SS type A sorting domain-containing protein [Sphingobacteriaceae bacterium]